MKVKTLAIRQVHSTAVLSMNGNTVAFTIIQQNANSELLSYKQYLWLPHMQSSTFWQGWGRGAVSDWIFMSLFFKLTLCCRYYLVLFIFGRNILSFPSQRGQCKSYTKIKTITVSNEGKRMRRAKTRIHSSRYPTD